MADADKKIAGVVQLTAYLMNSDAEGVAVALQGRVRKVTGAIAKGDMLVSAGNGMVPCRRKSCNGYSYW